MWHLKACKISVSLSFFNWIKNEMIFDRISELILAKFIQRYNENHFISRTREMIMEILWIKREAFFSGTVTQNLTFATLWANSTDDKLILFFLFLPENSI